MHATSMPHVLLVATAMLAISTGWAAEGPAPLSPENAVTVVTTAEAVWMPGPTAFPTGLELCVLQGDPSKDGPFVVRLRAPVGYRIPVHVHGGAEHVTIITGDLQVGTGKTFDTAKLRSLAPGDFISIPGNVPHYAMTTSGMVMQVHGNGPLTITCLDEQHQAHPPTK